ncbi:GGDEF domain-containing protein [Pseudonocardia endophytica]|uniref:Diguanylate cyclase (GGDEF)-like protein n=1 Tax=Pseudonocardia endophytica TaxID=401976 RepID=A0A4R1HQR1_PSEEN|nr:GGDEF domain-containing protein [Pseudonocardia endophytica]TCK24944.1 diguanylate cyclase (GGDEF)-like protein [Pseudonocardia endophytica]
MQSPRASLRHVTRWPVWAIPPRLLLSVLVVELLAIGLVTADALSLVPVTWTDAQAGLLLCGAAVLHVEAVLGVERIRRGSQESHHVDLNSVWTFAGALLLPPVLASAAVVVIYAYLFARVQRPTGIPAYKQVYSAATVVIAVHAAGVVLLLTAPGQLYGTVGGTFALLLALLAYTVVNTCLVLGVVAMASPNVRILRVLGSGDEVILEIATLSLGALVAAALTTTTPLAVLLVIPPILVLHRTILVKKLQERADTDAKTGLLNSAAWHSQSRSALRAAERSETTAGVLVLDLDHFKIVNDRHGHLAGDEVLRVVANTLREEVRDHDLVGRFGGEEFVVLLSRLADTDQTPEDAAVEVGRIGDRIRRRVRELRVSSSAVDGSDATIEGVTVSVGGAVFPSDGHSLTTLVATADAALYAAKRAGRDTVRVGPDLARSRDESPGGDPLAG